MGAERADLERRDRVGEVVGRAGRAGEVEDVIDGAVDLERLGDIVLDELELRVADQVDDVAAMPGQQVVDADHLVALGQETLAKVRADESRPAGDDRSHGDDSTSGPGEAVRATLPLGYHTTLTWL